MALTYPLINGVKYDWSSIELGFGGLVPPATVIGFKSLNYDYERTPGLVYGIGHSQPIARTRGRTKFEGDWEMFTADDAALMATLQTYFSANFPGQGQSEWTFDLSISYRENGQDTVTDHLYAVNLISFNPSLSQSDDPTTVKRKLSYLLGDANGVRFVSNLLPGSPGT